MKDRVRIRAKPRRRLYARVPDVRQFLPVALKRTIERVLVDEQPTLARRLGGVVQRPRADIPVTAGDLARSRGAGGQHVRLAMLDVAVSFLWPDGMMQHTLLADDGRVTTGPHMAADYLIRRTADGEHIALLATSNSQFPGLCAALGTQQWLADDRFSSLAAREANAAELNDMITAELLRHNGAEIVARLHDHDVPCALVNPVDRVHLDPQVLENAVLVEHERAWLGPVREPRPPAHFSATPTALGRHAPKFDEHTDEVLGEFGVTADSIAALRAAGTIGARR